MFFVLDKGVMRLPLLHPQAQPRPKPRYRKSELVSIPPGVFGRQYLLIARSRYLESGGRMGWYYEGPVFEVMEGEKLVVRNYMKMMPEENITPIPGDQEP